MRFISLLQPGSSSGNSGLNGIFFPFTREQFNFFFSLACFLLQQQKGQQLIEGESKNAAAVIFHFIYGDTVYQNVKIDLSADSFVAS